MHADQDALGDAFSPKPSMWPGGNGNGASPPNGSESGSGGGSNDRSYLVKALFTEVKYEIGKGDGDLIVKLVLNPLEAETKFEEGRYRLNPERYSHSISRHSEGAPNHKPSAVYGQFQTNDIMHSAREAFIDKYKTELFTIQKELPADGKQETFWRDISMPSTIGWTSENGHVTSTNSARFGFKLSNGYWTEISGYPIPP